MTHLPLLPAVLRDRLYCPFRTLLSAVLLPLAAAVSAQTGPQPRLPTTDITAGFHVIKAELAVTPEQQAVGMMFRKQMGTNEGMLFVNAGSGARCFWMRNTLLPLSIAFIGDDGTIVNIAEMAPQSDVSHCSARPVRFALEMNSGWFGKRGIEAGLRLQGRPFTKVP
ncbi:MAG: DUF192 domain-containing protein [Rubrivivax sp.]|nr:DUF192 domain-containing protein [Rubrivivax sp.]